MPIIDGGLEIRLYPTYIPPHLNAAAGAHQYFCAEDCRKRGHNDEIIVSIDPTYVQMVSCGVELREFREKNPHLAFVRIEVRIRNQVQLSIAKSAEDLRPGSLHFYTPTFDVRKAGLGGQVCIAFEAYGFGTKCTPYRIACRYEIRKNHSWMGVTEHFTDRNAKLREERKISSIPIVKQRRPSEESEGLYRVLDRPAIKIEDQNAVINGVESILMHDEDPASNLTARSDEACSIHTDGQYTSPTDNCCSESASMASVDVPQALQYGTVPAQCHEERSHHRVRFSGNDMVCQIDESMPICNGIALRPAEAAAARPRSMMKTAGRTTVRLRRPVRAGPEQISGRTGPADCAEVVPNNFNEADGADRKHSGTMDDDDELDYVGSPAGRVDPLSVQANSLPAQAEQQTVLCDREAQQPMTLDEESVPKEPEEVSNAHGRSVPNVEVKIESVEKPGLNSNETSATGIGTNYFDGCGAYHSLSRFAACLDQQGFGGPAGLRRESGKVKEELREIELETTKVKKEGRIRDLL